MSELTFQTFNNPAQVSLELLNQCFNRCTIINGGMKSNVLWASNYCKDRDLPIVIALKDGLPVSWVYFDHFDRVEMCTHTSYRRQGIATKLLIKLAEHMKRKPNFSGWSDIARLVIMKASEHERAYS
jgi:ribosomal protein S18 acetylase RimI-like enzyme